MNEGLLKAKDQNERLLKAKDQFVLEGQKAHIAINGAGAAALLAFLQAIWANESAAPLRAWVLCGIISFAIGTALGAASYQFRHLAHNKKAFTASSLLFRVTYWYIPIGTIVAFLLGLFLPVIGAFLALCRGA